MMFYTCTCSYVTKNSDLVKFHGKQSKDCMITSHESDFEGKMGIIYYVINGVHAHFGKYYKNERDLLETYAGRDIKMRFFNNCDISYTILMSKAKNDGVFWSSGIVRADSAERLLMDIED